MNIVKKNTVYNMLKSCSSIIFPLITFPYIARVLLTESIGKINFGLSIINYFSLLASLGIPTYAIRECSKVKSNPKAFSEISSNIYSINIYSTAIAYLLLAITLVVAKPLHSYSFLIIVQSLSIIFTTLGSDWLNNVMEDFKYITIRTISFNVLSIILMLIYVRNSSDYIIYAVITVIATAGANILNYFYRRKFYKITFVIKPNFSTHLKPIILLFSLQLVQIIYVNSDITILGILRSDHEIGLYSTSVKIYNLIQTIINSVVLVVLPQLSTAYFEKNYSSINNLLRYSLNFIIGLGLPCLIGINVIGKEAIILLAGNEYVESLTSLRILTIALLWSFLAGFLGNLIMIPSGRDNICLISSLISALINLVLNLFLIPRWGIEAAAFTTAVSQALGFFIKLPFIEKDIKLGPFRHMLLGPIIGCVFIILIGIITTTFIVNPVIKIVSIIILSTPIYILCLIIFKHDFAQKGVVLIQKILTQNK